MSDSLIIRTSDRVTFRRCRRKWAWASGLKQNRQSTESQGYFWIGTGGHFALEDYHGYNHYGHPVEAFKAYVVAQRKVGRLPHDWKEQEELGIEILNYYMLWLQSRDPYKTYWVDGEPQVEVRAQIPLPLTGPNGETVLYDLTMDKVIIDENGGLWIVDYKFYKQFRSAHLDTDTQVSAYSWGASTLYDTPIQGFIYHQFRKAYPRHPKVLTNGKISTDKSQNTSHRLYREALINMYGAVEKAPIQNRKYLNFQAEIESADRDLYIKRDKTLRNPHQIAAEGAKILMEAEEMINPNLALYPNPTGDCSWDCDPRDVCLMMDDGSDWEPTLEAMTEQRPEVRDEWRKYLP